MTSDAVFLGPTRRERWSLDQFKAFARPYFDSGVRLDVPACASGTWHAVARRSVAWFDEVLDNAKFGECRGSAWCCATARSGRSHYNLMVPIPQRPAPRIRGRRSGHRRSRRVVPAKPAEKPAPKK